jgi:hypothetical protein
LTVNLLVNRAKVSHWFTIDAERKAAKVHAPARTAIFVHASTPHAESLFICDATTTVAIGMPRSWVWIPYVLFGLCLKPETTKAQAVADSIDKHCEAMYGKFFDRNLADEYPELNEQGLAKLD